MRRFLSKLNIVESALLGMYLAMIPACYVAVKVAELGGNEFILMWCFYWTFAGPAFLIMLFNQIATRGKVE